MEGLRVRKTEGDRGRGGARKRRRETAAFARLRRQIASTTTEGAFGVFPCSRIEIRPFPVLPVLPQKDGGGNPAEGISSGSILRWASDLIGPDSAAEPPFSHAATPREGVAFAGRRRNDGVV